MERRHLTVLFCDLVGSTKLAADLDAEVLADVIFAYRGLMQSRIAAGGGTVAQYMGDGLLAYFGYPTAHDDDSARAVEAALAMLAALPDLDRQFASRLGITLRIRIGIHSGLTLVEVRDGTGPGLANVGAIGQAPNIAFRLQQLAAAKTALVSDTVYAQTSRLFDYEPKGNARLKGVPGAMTTFKPLRHARPQAARPAARELRGREKEFAHLAARWAKTVAGAGGAVLLTGDPGIGKSALTDRFIEHARSHGPVIRFISQFDAIQSPFRTILGGLQRQLSLGQIPPAARTPRLRRALRRAGIPLDPVLPLLCEFLGLAPPADLALPKLTTEGRRRLLCALLLDHLDRVAAARPVLVVVENVHWIDPSSEQWLARLAEWSSARRVLVLVTSRADHAPPWRDAAYVEHLSLDRLDLATLERILDDVAAGRILDPALRRAILERSDGVPLFLEELVGNVIDGGVATADLIPGSLRSLLAARLDRLGAAKRVALAAAVIGRHFPTTLLGALRPTRPRDLQPGLTALLDAGIVRPSHDRMQAAITATYTFKHALIRDAAYDSLLSSERRQYHARLLPAYAKWAPDILENQPEIVARHASAGGLRDDAVQLWTRAGAHALARSAYSESTSHYRQALDEAEHLDPPLTPAKLAKLCTDLATATIGSRGFAAPDVEQLSVHAYKLCLDGGDETALAAAIGGLTTFYQVRGPLDKTRELAERLLELAERSGDPGAVIRVTRRLGWCRFCQGEVAEGKELLASSLARYEARGTTERLSANEIDAGVIGHVNLGWAESFAGEAESALGHCESGMDLAVGLGERPADMAYALCMSAAVHQVLGDRYAALEFARDGLDVASRNALPYWQAWATIMLGWARSFAEPNAGLRLLAGGLDAYRATGARLFLPHSLGIAADRCLQQGRLRLAATMLDRADRLTEETGARFSQPHLVLTRARLLALTGHDEHAARAAALAHALARGQGARIVPSRQREHAVRAAQ